jgi:hypothetical protein
VAAPATSQVIPTITTVSTLWQLGLAEDGPRRNKFLARVHGEITSYLWKEILTCEDLTDILENYAQIVEEESKRTRKRKRKQIFPRYLPSIGVGPGYLSLEDKLRLTTSLGYGPFVLGSFHSFGDLPGGPRQTVRA